MNIFLTGASGFIGSHLLPKLLQANHKVYALSHSSKTLDSFQHLNLVKIRGSLNSDFTDYLNKTDYFIHLASYGVVSGSNDWNQCFNINVSQYLQILLAAVDLGVKKYFIVGSCFEYGRSGDLHTYIPVEAVLLPTSAYAASKVAATSISYALSVQHNLEMIIARPFHVYGEGEDQRRFWPSLVNAAKQGEDFPMTYGEQIRNFQHIDETTNQIIELIKNQTVQGGFPLLVNLGSEKPQRLLDFATSQWNNLNAVGSLLPGAIPYRDNEIMHYTPKLESSDFTRN